MDFETSPSGMDACVRQSTCNSYVLAGYENGDGPFTSDQRLQRRLMIILEHLMKLVSLIFMTAFTAIGLTLYIVGSAHAQGTVQSVPPQGTAQQIRQLELNQMQTQTIVADMPHRIDQMEIRISGLEASNSKIYGFGGGFGTILVLLQVFQILSPLKPRTP